MEFNRKRKHLAYTLLYVIIYASVIETKFTSFQRISEARTASDIGTWQMTFNERCVYLCTTLSNCLTVSYNRKSKQCDLGSSIFRMDQSVHAPDWDVFFIADNVDFVLVSSLMTWDDANEYCNTHFSGHLAHIKTEAEMEHVASVLGNDFSASTWLGATDRITEGLWLWGDSTPVLNGYNNWSLGQPDNFRSTENCLSLSSDNVHLNDMDCLGQCRSICQYSTISKS